MKPPICKLCQKAHWTYEPHQLRDVATPDYIKDMAQGAVGQEKRIVVFPDPNLPESVTTVTEGEPVYVESGKTCNACNKPYNNRGDVCNACRQRAYRERSK
jgi:hypothetical protein